MFKMVISTPGQSDVIVFPATLEQINRRVGMMEDDSTVTITVVDLFGGF